VEPERTEVRPADDPTASHALAFGRLIDLPRGIVWDALVDPVLVSGWLGDAEIDAVAGGRFDLRPGAPAGRRPIEPGRAVIGAIAAPVELAIESAADLNGVRTRVRFALEDVPGGPRDRSTALTVTVSSTAPFPHPERTSAAWLTHLDVLRDLLHGHPADWDSWATDWEPTWQTHHAGSRGGTAEPRPATG
jgi:uncharacterized protein YndB with AHSA1/START domain